MLTVDALSDYTQGRLDADADETAEILERSLAEVRKGEYEGLAAKLQDPQWAPDFGEPVFNEKSGATIVGPGASLSYRVRRSSTAES